MSEVKPDQIPFFPPARDVAHPFDPPLELTAWSKAPGLTRVKTWDGTIAWLVTRFRESRQVLGDNRFSADPRKRGFPEKSSGYKASIGLDHNLRTMDNPEHDEEKRYLARDFSVARLKELRPLIQDKTDKLIDEMLRRGPPAELFSDFALPIPTLVICEMLGVPYADRDFFAERAYTCLRSDVTLQQSEVAGAELNSYIDKLIDLKMKSPGNDLMTRLLVDAVTAGSMTREHAVGLGRLILIAGHETTANTIALSIAALLRYPDQLQLLRDDPAIVPNAVEELLRFLSVSHTGRRRVATADVEIGGQLIRAGEGVIVANSMADSDPSEFGDPRSLNLNRPNAKITMAFGYGIHQCLGQMLARAELQIVHSTLWRRIPSLALAVPFDEIQFREDTSVYGLKELPVTW